MENKFPISEKCIGCNKIENNFCKSYRNPNAWWKLGYCPLASHVTISSKNEGKNRVGQQKSKKKKS